MHPQYPRYPQSGYVLPLHCLWHLQAKISDNALVLPNFCSCILALDAFAW